MGLRDAITETLFGGNKDPLASIIKGTKGSSTTPEANITAPKGTFYIIDYQGDDTDYDIYINDDGGTSWELIYDASVLGHPGS